MNWVDVVLAVRGWHWFEFLVLFCVRVELSWMVDGYVVVVVWVVVDLGLWFVHLRNPSCLLLYNYI